MTTRIQLIDQFDELIRKLQGQRHKRPKMVKLGQEEVPEWHIYEMEGVLAEVNRQREANGFGRARMRDISRVEQMACGHSDYSRKLARYAADMSLEERNVHVEGSE